MEKPFQSQDRPEENHEARPTGEETELPARQPLTYYEFWRQVASQPQGFQNVPVYIHAPLEFLKDHARLVNEVSYLKEEVAKLRKYLKRNSQL